MGYRLDLGAWNGIFAVPCDIVDRQLRLCGEVQLKALLYILRHSSRTVELSELAQVCAISEADAADAVAYWQQEGIIVAKEGALAPPPPSDNNVAITPESPAAISVCAQIDTSPVSEQAVSEPVKAEIPSQPETARPKAKERIRYSYNECAEMMNEDSELRHMLSVVEGILAKNLNHTEISVFITLVKWYGLPASCVAMLVEYCREIGKSTIAYIETTGIGWVNEEITSVERATEKISQLRSARSAWGHLRVLLDISERTPTKKEQEYSSAWIAEWHIPDELIMLAYEKCVDNKGKLSMSYMNGIISNWHKKGILSVKQAAEDSASAAVRKPASESPSKGTQAVCQGMYEATYDKSEIEAMLDEDWLDDA